MNKKSISRLKAPAISGKKADVLISFLLFAVTFYIHWLVGGDMKMLHMSHDEMGVLASSAFAVGEDWSSVVSNIGYYGYGSSLLYIPVFLVTNGPVLRYRLIIAINSCIMSLIPIAAYYILTKYLNAEKITAATIALATGLYPGYLLYSKWVWNETLMCFIPWLLLLAVFTLYNTNGKLKKIAFSIILAFLLAYSYAVHGRGLAFIASVAVIIFVVLVFQRRLLIEPVSFVLSFVGTYIADSFCKDYILKNIWLAGESGAVNNTIGGTVGKLDNYLTADGFWGLLRIAGGQIFSASASSYGILIIALVIGIPLIFGGMKKEMRLNKGETAGYEHNVWMTAVFSLLFFAASFMISIVFLGNNGSAPETRGDYFIYTRYFSNVIGLVIFAGLYLVSRKTTSIKSILISVALYVLHLIPILNMAEEINEQPSTSNTTILNLLAYIGKNPEDYITEIDFNNLILIVSIVFVMILFAANSKKQYGLHLALCGVFLQSYFTTAENVILENSKQDYSYVHTTMHVLYQVPELDEHYPEVYYYNVHQRKPWSGSAMQFALPDHELTEFNFAVNDETSSEQLMNFITENSIIVSSEDIKLEQFDDSIYRMKHESLNTGDEYIWVYGDDIRDYILENSNLEFFS